MHTRIVSTNPYSYCRKGYAWEKTPPRGVAHLDFGCYDGSFLNSLGSKEIGRLVGVDISREAVAMAKAKYPHLEVQHLSHTVPLPFDDQTFASITVLEVIEHVVEQETLLKELSRVLADDGVLIVSVPGRHLFSFLDMGNLKFRFPRLHGWYYSWRHSREEYEHRYVSNPDGLVGDVSALKRWHEHFSRDKMRRLLTACGFEVVDFDGDGFFNRIIQNVRWVVKPISPLRKALDYLIMLDGKWFESANLYCCARTTVERTTA